MEKKTIGKFIAALRKANGMTQKELGEKLFVSDKTVSRWECDECTPEISLIPSIAEIFGITTDELLRGERNLHVVADNRTDTTEWQKAKSDKQFRLMLDNRQRKYKNFTLLSIGITVLGFIATLIANLAFSEGFIAFCLAAAFCSAGEICQICFAINARIMVDEDDDFHNDKIDQANTRVTQTAVTVTFFNIIILAFCLPLASVIDGINFGMEFFSWCKYGLLFALVALFISYIIYALFVRKQLHRHKMIIINDAQVKKEAQDNTLLIKTLVVSVGIALVIGIGIIVLNCIGIGRLTKETVFYNCSDFKEFMEREYDEWFMQEYGHYNDDEDIIYPNFEYAVIKNSKGEVICEYYYNPELYSKIIFTESSDDKMPVTVITDPARYKALITFSNIESALYCLIVLNFVVSAGIYLLKINDRKKNSYREKVAT